MNTGELKYEHAQRCDVSKPPLSLSGGSSLAEQVGEAGVTAHLFS